MLLGLLPVVLLGLLPWSLACCAAWSLACVLCLAAIPSGEESAVPLCVWIDRSVVRAL